MTLPQPCIPSPELLTVESPMIKSVGSVFASCLESAFELCPATPLTNATNMKTKLYSSSVLYNFVFILVAFVSGVAGQSSNADSKHDAKTLPTLFIIGDSTVNNSGEGMQGWGNVIGNYFDTSKINVVNRA